MSASQSGKAIADALQRRFGETIAVDENLSGLDELARMAGRRVHRRYTDRAVEPSLLRLLCACALSAPSKSDLQQADIVILEKPEQTAIADLDALRARSDRGQQRHRGSRLAGEMMHAEIGAVGAQFLGCYGQIDRLQQGVARRARLRARRRRPVPEGEKPDLLHLDYPFRPDCRACELSR